jgi:hypothetical protein
MTVEAAVPDFCLHVALIPISVIFIQNFITDCCKMATQNLTIFCKKKKTVGSGPVLPSNISFEVYITTLQKPES